MAVLSTSWTENQSFTGGVTGVTNIAQTTTGTVDVATGGYDLISAQVEVTSMGSSTSVTVSIYASPDSGTTVDDVPLHTYTFTAAGVKSWALEGHAFYSFVVTDDDSTSSADTDGHWAGRKWTDA